MLATSPSRFLPIALPLIASRRRWVSVSSIGQPQPPASELLSEDAVLFYQVLRDRELVAGYPAGHGEEEELKRGGEHGGGYTG